MRQMFLSLFLLAGSAFAADAPAKPAGVTVHTWVREDLFAAVMVDDREALERGSKKLDAILAANPDDAVAKAWRVLELLTRAAWANQKDDAQASRKLQDTALAIRATLLENKEQGVHIVLGGSLLFYAAKSPQFATEAMIRDGRDHLARVRKEQDSYFAKLPPHFSGELLSQLAFASDRLADQEGKAKYLAEMKQFLAGTAYARRADKWQAMAIKDWAGAQCISCHEPGRLTNVLSKLNQQQQQSQKPGGGAAER